MRPFKGIAYGSHLPVLAHLLSITNGDVIEFGAGIFSTPFLHWMCAGSIHAPKGRRVFSYDNDQAFLDRFELQNYTTDRHQIMCVSDWDTVPVDRPWDVALIDHGPVERRAVDALRVAHATYVVLHDSGSWDEKHYHYAEHVFLLFRYRCDFRPGRWTQTTVLSNTKPLDQIASL